MYGKRLNFFFLSSNNSNGRAAGSNEKEKKKSSLLSYDWKMETATSFLSRNTNCESGTHQFALSRNS